MRCFFQVYLFFAVASHGTPHLVLNLVGMHSAAASIWVVMKFSYSSFGECVSNIP